MGGSGAVVILDLLAVDVASGGYELVGCSHGEEETIEKEIEESEC